MAKLEISGFDGLDAMFDSLANLPWEVLETALGAMGDVAMDKVRAMGSSMGVRDPESNVHILDKLRLAKAKKTDDGGHQDVTFSGSRTRNGKKTRNAEIAFVNEYGKRNQQARPFIRQANEQYADEIAAPGEQLIGDWFEKTFMQ